MNVRELIENLLLYNLDAEVCTSHSESIEIGYIDESTIGETFTRENTPIVFIDGCDNEETVAD